MNSCPCNGCKDRHQTCHSNCEKYINWKTKYNARNELIKKNKFKDSLLPASKFNHR